MDNFQNFGVSLNAHIQPPGRLKNSGQVDLRDGESMCNSLAQSLWRSI
jgi:hypothetical protein